MRKFLSMWVQYPSFYICMFMSFVVASPTTVPGLIFWTMITICNLMLICLCEGDMYRETPYVEAVRRWHNSKGWVSQEVSDMLFEEAMLKKR